MGLLGRRCAEPLLWFGLAVGLLWVFVLNDAPAGWSGAYPDANPVPSHLAPMAMAFGPGLVLMALLTLGTIRTTPAARWSALAVGLLLAVAGLGLHRIADIQRELVLWFALVPALAGLALVGLSLLRWPPPRPGAVSPGPAGVAAALVLGALAAAVGLAFLEYAGWGWVGVHVEDQPAWDYGVPTALLLVGLVAATVHALRRRWGAVLVALVLTAVLFGTVLAASVAAV